MNTLTHKTHCLTRVGIGALLLAVIGALGLAEQPAKVVSSYGPINQSETFEQIKAGRMAVKAERAKSIWRC